MDLPFAARLALGDARLTLVEKLERSLHGIADLAPGRGRDGLARIERALDGGLQSGQGHVGFLEEASFSEMVFGI